MSSSLKEDLMWLSKFRQLITFYHLEASITPENLIQGGADAVHSQILIVNEESLLLTWVENDKAWCHQVIPAKCVGEVTLRLHVKSEEVEHDSSLNLAREDFLDLVERQENSFVTLGCAWHQINDAEDTVLLQTELIATVLAEEWNLLGQPWLDSRAFHGLLGLSKDKSLRIRIDELEDVRVIEVTLGILDWFLLIILEDEQGWELLDFVLADESFLL